MGRRWNTARSACREILEFAGELRDALRRPDPVHWPYIRCDRCGLVAPHTSHARTATFAVDTSRTGGRRFTSFATPPETVCPLCQHRQTRTVGDELPAATADAGEAILDFACGYRWGLLRGWRRCRAVFTAPATAAVICPVCGTVTLGPAAED